MPGLRLMHPAAGNLSEGGPEVSVLGPFNWRGGH